MAWKMATRNAYGEALAEVGADPRIVALDADVSTCTMSCVFGRKYPERFYNAGIAEANMVGVAAGMASCGLIPFVHSFAMFAAGRAFDQIRNMIAYPGLNVKVVGTHAGLTVGEDGATHQCLEDIGILRTIPGMTILCPADAQETFEAVRAMAGRDGPMYLRLGRMAVDAVTDAPGYRFELGRAVRMREGFDVTIIAAGIMVRMALEAAARLEGEGIRARVVNMHTVKPLDEEEVLRAARETGAIVTAEEHNVLGGLGAAVAEAVTCAYPVPVVRVGVGDAFGRSGNAEKLLELYGLDAAHILEAARRAIDLKK